MVAAKTITALSLLTLLVYPRLVRAATAASTAEKGSPRLDEVALTLFLNSDTPLADVLDMVLPEEDYLAVDAFELKNGVDIETLPMSSAPIRKGIVQYRGNKIDVRPDHTVKVDGAIIKYDSMKTPFQNWQTLYSAITKLPARGKATAGLETPRAVSNVLRSLLGNFALAEDCDSQTFYCESHPHSFWSHLGDAAGDVGSVVDNAAGSVFNGFREVGAVVGTTVAAAFHGTVASVKEALVNNGTISVVCYNDGYGFSTTNSAGQSITIPVHPEALRSMVHGNVTVPDSCSSSDFERAKIAHWLRPDELADFEKERQPPAAAAKTAKSTGNSRRHVCRSPASNQKNCKKPGSHSNSNRAKKNHDAVAQ